MISDPGPRLDWIDETFNPIPARVREVVALLDGLGRDVLCELFAAHGLQIEEAGPAMSQRRPSRAPPRSPQADLISSIGFSSEGLFGSLILGLALGVAEKTVPVDGSNLTDWTSELDNQLLGRFKNRLMRHGLHLEMSVPMTVSADMTLASSPRQILHHHAFSSKFGPLWLRLDLEVSPWLELGPYTAPSEPVLAEGDLLFF